MRNDVRSIFLILILLGAVGLGACNNDDKRSGTTVQPATVEALMLQKFDDIPGFSAALGTVLLHVMGMAQPGVNLTPTADGWTGTVEVDKDFDGIPEGVVAGTLTYDDPMQGISGGATIHLTELTGNIIDMTASVALTGPTELTFDDIVANVPVDGTRPEVDVTSGRITVDMSTSPPTLTGFANFIVGDLPARMTLMNDGTGNPAAVIEGDGFMFSVP